MARDQSDPYVRSTLRGLPMLPKLVFFLCAGDAVVDFLRNVSEFAMNVLVSCRSVAGIAASVILLAFSSFLIVP